MEIKRHWLGQKWYLPGAAGNDINKVLAYRWCIFEPIIQDLHFPH